MLKFLNFIFGRVRISIATKLILSFLIIIVITSTTFTVVGIRLISDRIVKEAQEKVRNDLNSAREIYINTMGDIKDILRITADSFFLRNAILSRNREQISARLMVVKNRENLDILTLTDEEGKVILRTDNPSVFGDDQSEDEVVKAVLIKKEPLVSTSIVSAFELGKESEALVQRAYFKFIPTPKARYRKETEETSGMMIKSAVPIFDFENNLIGVLYGGILLNRNYEIVDKIKSIVYQNVKYKGNDIGTATIFQDDLRISTNVRNLDGSRAVGTRIAEDVYNQVVIKGEPWIGRAFVVNNWYITAYEPIKNINNKIIGILYVGILENKFVDIKRETILIFLGITIVVSIIAFLLSHALSRSISIAIKKLVDASHQMANGNLDTNVQINTNDELKELAETFNYMANAIKKRDDELKEFAKKRIMQSERLAMIGQLSAGIAHEINNPLQGILTYSSLMLEEIPKDDPRANFLQKIVTQTIRCKNIVRGLLDFSRQTKSHKKLCQINQILEDSISLVEKQVLFQNIEVIKKFGAYLSLVEVDPSQIQQVFMNIIINAAEAMNGKGKLTIISRKDSSGKYIEIEFTDTGHGISEENLEKIFEPFFTTKEAGHGTGLGLAISHGIIKDHNGDIEVKSKVGEGTTFIIRLPIAEEERLDKT